MHEIGFETQVFSATLVSDEELNRSPVLKALLPEAGRPERLAIVLVGHELRQETLLVDGGYLALARSASLLHDSVLDRLDLPRHALVARIAGWPDTWDPARLTARRPRLIRGVWEFPSDREPEDDYPLL